MDYEIYDKETSDAHFSMIKYSKYTSVLNDALVISVKNSTSIEQLATESLVRIWRMIYRAYSQVKNSSPLESENILNYVNSELTYSKNYWGYANLDKRIQNSFQRLKNFIVHIHINDPEGERKNGLKQYIVRVIAIIFKYPSRAQQADPWSNRIKKLLRSVINTCDEKIAPNRLPKAKNTTNDESPTLIDIDSLISQLPSNQSPQKLSKEKLKLTLQSLVKNVSSEKSIIKSPGNKSLLNSIYKDSTQYRYFSSKSSTSSSYLDSIQISDKRPSILLENISSLDRLKTGQWEEAKIERKNTRNRTGIDKRKVLNRNFRITTREYIVKDSISEEPENHKNEDSEENEESDEISSENPSEKEVVLEDDEISNELQQLISLNTTEKEIDSQISFVKQNTQRKNIFGRNPSRS